MDTALRESLKALRLSGMLETLDVRMTQTRGGELGHLDFLQILRQDENTHCETERAPSPGIRQHGRSRGFWA